MNAGPSKPIRGSLPLTNMRSEITGTARGLRSRLGRGPGGDRAVVVVAPLRPRAGIERGVEPGDRERGDLVCGSDAGPAVGRDGGPLPHAERLEPAAQLLSRTEASGG